jgi:peptidoglycan/LPS O-acetylase OafA/YrhL
MIYLMGPLMRRLYELCYPILGGYGFAVCAVAVLIPTLLVAEVTYRLIEVPGIGLGKRSLNNLKLKNTGAI